MRINSVSNPNVDHDMKGRSRLAYIRLTFWVFRKAVKAIYDPNVISFSFDKRPYDPRTDTPIK